MTQTQTQDAALCAPTVRILPDPDPAPVAALGTGRAVNIAERTLALRGPLLACAVLLAIFAALGVAFGALHVLYTPRRAAFVGSALLLVMHR